MHAVRPRAALWLAVLLMCASRASALNPALDISQLSHTAWKAREGFFSGGVSSIAQTPDGYLWLGTETGLLRFDGVRAVPWLPPGDQSLPSLDIVRLLVTRDGRLWIGTRAGLASWKDNRLVTYPEFDGEAISSLAEDSQRTVWAGTVTVPNGLLCAIRTAVQCFGRDRQFGISISSLFADGDTVWVGTSSGLWRWTAGEITRQPSPPNVNDILKLDDGRLLIATSEGVKQMVGDELDVYPIRDVDRAFQLLVDRNGGMWIARRGGLSHVYGGRTDFFRRSDGLSGEAVQALFEDREGNIWVATNEGLDRFREPAVTFLSGEGHPTELTSSVLRAGDGSVWVGAADGLRRWKDGRTTIYRTRNGLPDDRIGTIFEDSAGRILVATLGGLVIFDGERFARFGSVRTRIVYGIVEERRGAFWISDQEQGLIHLVDEQVVQQIPWSAFGRADHATALLFDRTRAGLWLGFYRGGVLFVQNGTTTRSYGSGDGLGGGRVAQLQVDPDGALWAATAGGLSRIVDNRVATMSTDNGLPCGAVHWTIADVDRSRWLLMPCGLASISAAEVAAWIADPNRSVKTALFDSSDGVQAIATPIGFSPPAASMADGRLWFASPSGVGVVDPRTLPFNTVPPPVTIEQLVADRRSYDTALDANERVRLPPRVHDLQIDYTALSLTVSERVRFRYQLEGFDRDWQEVGNRRQAFYTDLPPGAYRFRVAAANNSGVWNETGATIAFTISPTYYQTWWFLALSAGMVVGLVWGGHRVRLRIVERHQREISALNERLMKAQEQERIRIAGELHDGVMQEMLAATMMLGTAKRRIPAESDAIATIDKVQQKLIQAGTDLRQLSHGLHPPLLQEAGLPAAVSAYCEQFSIASGIPVSCEAQESVGDLSRGSALALFRIVQEALGNAAKHSAARRITVRLQRSDDVVSLTVSDDGAGFDRSRLAGGGGLGLVMMRERASQLNGTFEFESEPGAGTTIRVAVPFR